MQDEAQIYIQSLPAHLKQAINKMAQVRKVKAAIILEWVIQNGLDVLNGKLIIVGRGNAERIKQVNGLSKEEWEIVLKLVQVPENKTLERVARLKSEAETAIRAIVREELDRHLGKNN